MEKMKDQPVSEEQKKQSLASSMEISLRIPYKMLWLTVSDLLCYWTFQKPDKECILYKIPKSILKETKSSMITYFTQILLNFFVLT